MGYYGMTLRTLGLNRKEFVFFGDKLKIIVGFYARIGNMAETRPFSETSRCRDRDETEALDLRDRDFEKYCLETETCLETLQLCILQHHIMTYSWLIMAH